MAQGYAIEIYVLRLIVLSYLFILSKGNKVKYSISFIFILFAVMYQSTHADIEPVIVSSEIKNDSWFPLPLEQMKDAAVDTALTKISETGGFAFLYNPDARKNIGKLKLKVSLVEPAESAKITIILTLGNQRGTYVSSSSISLSNKDYKGIFKALEKLGKDGAEQIVISLENMESKNKITNEELKLRSLIKALNKKIINLDYSLKESNLKKHNKKVMFELAKLDVIIKKIDRNYEYVKKSDVKKNKKLDAIYIEIQKLNIGQNTDNTPPSSKELTEYDITQLSKLTKSNELKYEKKFEEARILLAAVKKDHNISSVLRVAVNEELKINLPLYEAEVLSNQLSFSFVKYLKNEEYKIKLKNISHLYNRVLTQRELSFKKRVEIREKISNLNLKGDSMKSAANMIHRTTKHSFARNLDVLMQKHMYMGSKSEGQCPNAESVIKEMRKANLSADVISYKDFNKYECKLRLKVHNIKNKYITFVFSADSRTKVIEN